MSTVLKTMEDIVNNVAPLHTTTHLVPRGVPRFIDQNLKGNIQFSRRIGNTLPTIQPQNQVTLTQDAPAGNNLMFVDSILDGIETGSLILINNQEILEIKDVDAALYIITLVDDLYVSHAAGSPMSLFGVPINVYSPVNPVFGAATSSFYVRSPYQIASGDQIYITQSPEFVLSGTSFTVTESLPLDPVGTDNLFYVTINSVIPRPLGLNEKVYLRSYPGYRSNRLTVPLHRKRPIYLGPFVVDYASGRFDDGPVIKEFLSLQAYNSIGDPLLGSAPVVPSNTHFVSAYKNYPIISVPIHASSFLFWDVVRGSVNYKNDTFIIKTDDKGRACITTELSPPWVWQGTGSLRWTCYVKGIDANYGSVYYRFYPSANTLAGSVNMSSSTQLAFNLGSNQTATRIELTFVGPPNASISMTSWFPSYSDNPTADCAVDSLEYRLISQVIGNNIWQAGSLMIKPYFNVVADIEGRLDFDSLNNGAVLF